MIKESAMRILKTIIVVFVAMFVLEGCASNTMDVVPIDAIPRDIRLLIGDEANNIIRVNTLIEISGGGIIETTVFTCWDLSQYSIDKIFDTAIIHDFVTVTGDNILISEVIQVEHFTIDKSERVLSQRQLNNIWELTENVVNDGADKEFEWVFRLGTHVWAIIDGDMYWSLYIPDMRNTTQYPTETTHFNDDLLILAYYLIDLSPIRVGYERSPEMRSAFNESY